MAVVADYLALSDRPATLDANGTTVWKRDFTLTSDARLDMHMILQFFFVHLRGDMLEFRCSVNGSSIRNIVSSIKLSKFGTVHEVLAGEKLTHGNNGIRVKLVVPPVFGNVPFKDLTVQISDVLLWYQRQI